MHLAVSRSKPIYAAVLAALVLIFGVLDAIAVEVEPVHGSAPPCAVLENYAGQVDLLDSSRSYLLDTALHAGIPCKGWVSVGTGWAKIRLRDGHWVNVGSRSFVQIYGGTEGVESGESADHLVLYQGQVWGRAGEGSGELRVLTTNARARMKEGSGIVLYSAENEETQLVSTMKTVTLENRFEAAAKMTIKAGEATSLNLKTLRNAPTTPRTVSVASLKPKLSDLHLNPRDQGEAIQATWEREERRFPTVLARPKPEPDENAVERKKGLVILDGSKRSIASEKAGAAPENRYSRHRAKKDDASLRKHLLNRLVAGQDAEKLLHPDRFYGKPQQVKLLVVDPLAARNSRQQKEENAEKARLIEELSHIRIE